MTVAKLMNTSLISVTMDDNLARVKDLFEQHKFHHILVIEHNKLVGVISDRDLLKAISPRLGTASETNKDLASLNKRAHQIMHRELITIDFNTPIYQAIKVFNQYKVSCLPIVNDNNKPLGILSWRDIFQAIEASQESKNSTLT